MTLDEPIDIVIPSFKPQRFEQALRSAIAQTYPNIKIYVSDNCPTEEIADICKRFSSLKVIYTRSPVYQSNNYEFAFRLGSSRYVKPLFDDDVLHPTAVAQMYSALKESTASEPRLIFSQSGVINGQNELIQTRRPFVGCTRIPRGRLPALMLGQLLNFIGEFSTVMFARSLVTDVPIGKLFRWRDISGYDGLPDVVFYLMVNEVGAISYIDECLSFFRIDDSIPSDTVIGHPSMFTKWFDLVERGIEGGQSEPMFWFEQKPRRTDDVSRCSEMADA